MVAILGHAVEKAGWGSFVADGAAFSDFMFSLTREEILYVTVSYVNVKK